MEPSGGTQSPTTLSLEALGPSLSSWHLLVMVVPFPLLERQVLSYPKLNCRTSSLTL